jgi:hypothetical protein
LESTGYSLNEALGLNGSVSQASELYKSNSFYKSVADTVASISATAKANRLLLREAMERHGFKNYAKEWWHFSLGDEPYKTNDFAFDFEVQ